MNPFIAIILLLATQPTTIPDAENAATYYQSAIEQLQTSADPASINILSNWQRLPLDEKTDTLLADCRESLHQIHTGAQLSQCNWGLDWEDGPNVQMPYLNGIRQAMQLDLLNVRFELQDEQYTHAADDACDVLTMARHAGSPGIMISRLVEATMEHTTDEFLALNLKKLDKDALRELQSRLENLPPQTPLSAAMRIEERMLDWDSKSLHDYPKMYTEDMFIAQGLPQADVEKELAKSGGKVDGVIKALEGLRPYFGEMQALLNQNIRQTDFAAKSSAILEKYRADPFGALMLPDFSKSAMLIFAAQTQTVELKAAIAVLLGNPDQAKNFQDTINHEALKYVEIPDGFEIDSTVRLNGEPVVLKVGGK